MSVAVGETYNKVDPFELVDDGVNTSSFPSSEDNLDPSGEKGKNNNSDSESPREDSSETSPKG